MLFAGLIVATTVSVGLAFGKDYMSTSLRNPDDVRLLLEIPVLASFPKTITGQD
jgi:capsular polysaccharide biosynthesis protein